MSLQNKIISALLITGIFYGLFEFVVQKQIVYQSFIDIENSQAQNNLNRCIRAIQNENEHLNKYCNDWAAWDETVAFVQGKNENYIQRNGVEPTLISQHLNLMCFLDANDHIVWSKCVRFEENNAIEVSVRELSPDVLVQGHILLGHKNPEDHVKGILMTELGLIMVSSRPIINNNSDFPIYGTLIMGRLINDDFMTPLNEQTQVEFQWWNLANQTTRQPLDPYLSAISKDEPVLLERRPAESFVAAYQVVPGLNTDQALLLKAITPCQITAKGKYAISVAMWSMIIGSGLILVIVQIMLERLILKPTRKLKDFALHIARTGNLSDRIKLNSKDEIASLANSFNAMIGQLHQARIKAMEHSYNTGIAELSSGILGDIRNALTLLKTEVDSLNLQVKKLPLDHIKQAREELANPDLLPQQRMKLEQFLATTNQNLADTLDNLLIGFKIIAEPISEIEQHLIQTSSLSQTTAEPPEPHNA